MEKLQSVQVSAAIAITGTRRGTLRDQRYLELGWEAQAPQFVLEKYKQSHPCLYKRASSFISVVLLSSYPGCNWANTGKNRNFSI